MIHCFSSTTSCTPFAYPLHYSRTSTNSCAVQSGHDTFHLCFNQLTCKQAKETGTCSFGKVELFWFGELFSCIISLTAAFHARACIEFLEDSLDISLCYSTLALFSLSHVVPVFRFTNYFICKHRRDRVREGRSTVAYVMRGLCLLANLIHLC